MEENNPSAQAPLSDPSAQAPEPGTAPIQPQQPPEPAVPETPTVPPQGQKSNTILWVALILLVLSLLGGVGYFLIAGGNLPFLNQQKACTQEVRVCPDGTSVGRSGPNCEFAPCPTLTPSPSLTPDPTANWKTYTNNEYGFSLKYPTGFNIEDNSTNFPPFNITIKDSTKQLVGEGGGKFNPGIHIQVQSEKMSLDQYLSKYANSLIVRNKQKINGSEFTIIEATIGHARTFAIFN